MLDAQASQQLNSHAPTLGRPTAMKTQEIVTRGKVVAKRKLGPEFGWRHDLLSFQTHGAGTSRGGACWDGTGRCDAGYSTARATTGETRVARRDGATVATSVSMTAATTMTAITNHGKSGTINPGAPLIEPSSDWAPAQP